MPPFLASRLRAIDVDHPRTVRAASWIVPLLFGLWSLRLGVDANWDLHNYHLYNAFALLNGKLRVDLAAAGLQTYFNPLLDLPYYLASQWVPAPVIAFAMGTLHGSAFVLLLRIAMAVLGGLSAGSRILPLLLALAGVCSGNFLSELGNTMGDNTTALLCLGSLAVALSGPRGATGCVELGAWRVACAGLLMGLAMGLKLTNAIYGVALCAAMLVTGASARQRLQATALCALAVAAGAALSGGWWHYRVWAEFGNPVFPQFTRWFPNPLAREVMVADSQWFPRGFAETIAWPFVFSWDSLRVGQARVRQLLWPVLYALVVAWCGMRARQWISLPRSAPRGGTPTAFLVVFIATAYLAWLQTFSIYRYLIAAELLAPITIFAVLASLLRRDRAVRWAIVLLGASTLLTLARGFETWGHAPLARRVYEMELPPLQQPSASGVLIVSPDPPWTWVATRFPREVAFVQLGGSFPEGPAFAPRVREIMAGKRAVFAIVDGGGGGDRREEASAVLLRYGFTLDAQGCRPYHARMGGKGSVYLWCPVRNV